MVRATLTRPNLLDPLLGERWEAAARAWGAPAFRRWAWVGCLAAERFDDPVLAEVHEGTALIGMALFNRRQTRLGPTLFLHETGDAALDGVFIEQNGMLAAPGQEAAAVAAVLRMARRVVFSGVDDGVLAAVQGVGGIVGPLQTRLAPYAPLTAEQDPVAALSRNARAQVRRSNRGYEASGPLRVERAATAGQAIDWLEQMGALHAAGWAARGVVSGFMAPPVQRFHRALMERGVEAGLVDMLHVAAGARTVGYLLNLVSGTKVAAYQSGFDYAGAGPHEKPGISCHAAAMRQAAQGGMTEYDFLGGDTRYKRSLAGEARALHWLTWQRRLSVAGVAAWGRSILRG